MMADDGKVVHFPVKLRKYRFKPEIQIPRRPWLMRGLLLRSQVSAIIAAGSVGKSSFGLTVALHLCAGRTFGPFACTQTLKVAVLSVEEDDDELDRRLAAIRRQFDFTQDDADRLFIISTVDAPLLASADRRGAIHRTEVAKQLENLMMLEGIDVVIVDPFIEVWQGAENDNSQVRAAAAVIRDMARHMNAAVLLMHHVRKGVITPGDIDAARGGSSLAGLVRIAYTMTRMTKEDAALFGLTSHKGLVRLDGAKANYLADPENAQWLKFHDIQLENGDDELGIHGDHVGTLKPWAPPGLFDAITYDAINDCLDAITKGPGDYQRYAFAAQAKDRWVGTAIMEQFDITEERAARILKSWKKSGLLFEQDYVGDKSRLRKGVFVNDDKRPSATSEDIEE